MITVVVIAFNETAGFVVLGVSAVVVIVAATVESRARDALSRKPRGGR